MLISQKPKTEGQAAAQKRARHITDFTWTPIFDVPTYTKNDGKTVLPAGKEVTGMPYSSTEGTNKFLYENISLANFLTVLANKESALYKRENPSSDGKSRAYFGTVCNGLARYALEIRRRISTKRWREFDCFSLIGEAGEYKLEDIEICDILHAHVLEPKKVSHVAMITDVLRDETGEIKEIEVSEMIRPVAVRRRFNLEDYFTRFGLYALMRYKYIDSVKNDEETERKLFSDCEEKKAPKIAVDFGNKMNYLYFDDIVLSVFTEGENEVIITRDGENFDTLSCIGEKNFTLKLPKGYYKATLNGEYTVEFCVCKPKITYSVKNGYITVNADSCDKKSEILYMDFREAETYSLHSILELSEEEKKTGKIVRKIPEGAGHFKVYFENNYAIWTDGGHDFRGDL